MIVLTYIGLAFAVPGLLLLFRQEDSRLGWAALLTSNALICAAVALHRDWGLLAIVGLVGLACAVATALAFIQAHKRRSVG